MPPILRSLAVAALLAAAPAAHATTIVVNFDNLAAGSAVGTVNGLVFTNFLVSTGFGPTSGPNFAYNNANPAGFDYANGFTSLSFSSGVFADSVVSVYSGLGGTGTLLGTLTVTNPPANPNAFAPFVVNFEGVGRSVVVAATGGQFGWDDVTINGVAAAVPEPASWAMLVAGFALVGVASRRRRAVVAA